MDKFIFIMLYYIYFIYMILEKKIIIYLYIGFVIKLLLDWSWTIII